MKALFSLASIFILATSTAIQASPTVEIRSGSGVLVTSSHLQAAPGGGTYVSGISQPASGISAPLQPHLHIIVYGRKGDILAEETDTLNRSALTVNHYSPRPRAPYTIYLPVDESRIGKIIISSHSGHHHPEAKNLKVS